MVVVVVVVVVIVVVVVVVVVEDALTQLSLLLGLQFSVRVPLQQVVLEHRDTTARSPATSPTASSTCRSSYW